MKNKEEKMSMEAVKYNSGSLAPEYVIFLEKETSSVSVPNNDAGIRLYKMSSTSPWVAIARQDVVVVIQYKIFKCLILLPFKTMLPSKNHWRVISPAPNQY